jgi:hypothetical protein
VGSDVTLSSWVAEKNSAFDASATHPTNFLIMCGVNRRFTPMNANLRKKYLKLFPKSAFICAYLRFPGTKIEIGENPTASVKCDVVKID